MREKDPAKTLYLVDGSGYIFRAYYAVRSLSTRNGLPTNALLGFTRMLNKLLRQEQAQYLVVTFDTAAKTFRHDRYPEYKANRGECPEDLVPQMPYFREIVRTLGLPCFEKEGFEADDIIATLVDRFASEEHDLVIVSGDKDLTQLVKDGVEVWDAMRDRIFDTPGVVKKFGVSPEQMVDLLALMGDASDNIPGVRGVGPKTAERLIAHFGSIDALIEKSEEIEGIKGLRGAKSVRTKIESGVDALRLSRELVSLDKNVEPFHSMNTLDELRRTTPDSDKLQTLFAELEFESLLGSLDGLEMRNVSSEPQTCCYQLVSKEALPALAQKLAEVPAFAFDTETSSLDTQSAELLGISLSWCESEAYYIPVHSEIEAQSLVLPEVLLECLQPIFGNPEIKKRGFNLKFDLKVLEENGFTVAGVDFDAMLAAHVLHPDRRDLGLKVLAERYLNEQMSTYKEVLGEHPHLGFVPLVDVCDYAAADAVMSWRLCEKLTELLEAQSEGSLNRVFTEVEMPLVPVLVALERSGMKLDILFLERLGEEFSAEIEMLKGQIFSLAGGEFNLNSPKQLNEILFERLGLPTKGLRKKQHGFSTNALSLQKLTSEHEIAEKLLEYREVHKLKSTYVDALVRLVSKESGRIYASFNQAGTATGRLSSSDPNLQNIPIRNPRGRRIRQAFIAETGNVLVSADYSQIELRVLAHLSADENLTQAFCADEDIHMRTARELFGEDFGDAQERKRMRRIAKTINFGLVYGMSAFRLAREISVSRKQAQRYIDDYFARYPRVLEYFDEIAEMAERKGYVETMFGRRRYRSELDVAGRDAGYAERSLANAPIQGSAAEIMKLAMIALHARLANEGGSARIVLQVHDELVVEVAAHEAPEVSELIATTMEDAVALRVPLKVDVRVGETWGEREQ